MIPIICVTIIIYIILIIMFTNSDDEMDKAFFAGALVGAFVLLPLSYAITLFLKYLLS